MNRDEFRALWLHPDQREVFIGDIPPRFLAKVRMPGGLAYAAWAKPILSELEGNVRARPMVPVGALVSGPTGIGKTHAAVQFVLACRGALDSVSPRRSAPVRFTTDREFIRKARDAMNDGGLGRYIEQVSDRAALVLDDLGSGVGECYTEFEKGILSDLLGLTYDRALPMLITSNHDLPGLSRVLGARVASRIAELCQVYAVDGADRRLEARQPALAGASR